MGLDTRGFMDGALRGYDLMDRHYARERQQKLDDERLAMQKENHDLSLRQSEQQMRLRNEQNQRANEEYELKYGKVGEDGKRTGGTYQEDRERSEKLSDARLKQAKASTEANNSARESNEYRLSQQKKSDYIRSNLSLIQSAWDKFNTTGDVDDVLNNQYVFGSAYDPRRYLNKKLNSSLDIIEQKLPEIVKGNGDVNDKSFVDALGEMYQDQVKASVGQQDPVTGKTIKDAKLGGVHLANDIDPDTPGNQPGLVLTTLVNYGDGKWVAKPITNDRSTSQGDAVKVIPVETAMKDITSQLALRQQASTSKVYQQVFNLNDKASKKARQSKLDDALIELETEKAKAISKLDKGMLDEKQYSSSVKEIETQFDNAKQRLIQQLSGTKPTTAHHQFGHSMVPQWANGDPQKVSFARDLQSAGKDVGSMPEKELQDRWDIFVKVKKDKETEERNAAILSKVNKGMSESGIAATSGGNLSGNDPRYRAGVNHRTY